MKGSKTKLSMLFAILALLAVFVSVKMVAADSGSNVSGYAWSSNIGWIRFNDCDNPGQSTTCNPSASYGVSVLPVAPGAISGYAWSSNIGWITFNDPSCPTSGCTPGAYVDWNHPNSDGSFNVRGWARVCSVYASGCSGTLQDSSYLGTWDGYIALDSLTAGGNNGSWGLTVGSDRSTISGYAWGSQVVGWVHIINASIYAGPAVQLTPNPATINQGDSSVLTATASDIDGPNACSIAGAPTLTMSQQNGSWIGTVTVSPSATTTYTVNCTKGSQTATAQATVNVMYFITPPSSGGGSGTGGGSGGGSGGSGGTGGGSGGGSGTGSNGDGGYCTSGDPEFAWSTDATQCTLTRVSDGQSVQVGGTSEDTQVSFGSVSQGTDGLYYFQPNLPVTGTSSTYTLQCTGGTEPVNFQIAVPACIQDYSLTATPTSTQLVPSSDGSTTTAIYTIGAIPNNGFVGTINLGMSWPSNIPNSKVSSFSPATLTCDSNGCSTSQLTISVNIADIKGTVTYGTSSDPMVVQGTSGELLRTVAISAGATVKVQPVYNEF